MDKVITMRNSLYLPQYWSLSFICGDFLTPSLVDTLQSKIDPIQLRPTGRSMPMTSLLILQLHVSISMKLQDIGCCGRE